MPQFWRLTKPTENDYRDALINGEVRATHELPVTGCRTCARRRSSGRVLPVDCPLEWQHRPEVTPQPRREHRVTNAEFSDLRIELTPSLGPLPANFGALEPGDRFQPLLLRIGSRPESDFLWPEVGGFLLSERVKALWEREGVSGVVFSRVQYEPSGQRIATKGRKRRGEPETIPVPATAAADPSAWPNYYCVTITEESGLPPGVDPATVCPECGRAMIPASGSSRRILFEPSMWRGADVCRLATTALVIVTERVKQGLEHLAATNILFKPADEEVVARSAV